MIVWTHAQYGMQKSANKKYIYMITRQEVKKKNQLMINGSDLFRVVLNWVAWRKMIIIVLSSSEDLLE